MIDSQPAADPQAARRSPLRSGTAARFVLAVLLGLAVGAWTEWEVLRITFALEPLTNTAAPWVLLAFLVALTARRVEEAVALAVVTLLALVVGFYLAQATRGWEVSHHQLAFWLIASFVAGPLVGLAAGWLRHGGRLLGSVGAGIVGGIFVGEAAYGIRKLTYSSPHPYWRVQIGLGIAIAVGLPLWRCRRDLTAAVPALAASLAVCAGIGLATLAAYLVV
jgi:hypothetical protein